MQLFVKKGDAFGGYRVGAEIGIFLNALQAVGRLDFLHKVFQPADGFAVLVQEGNRGFVGGALLADLIGGHGVDGGTLGAEHDGNRGIAPTAGGGCSGGGNQRGKRGFLQILHFDFQTQDVAAQNVSGFVGEHAFDFVAVFGFEQGAGVDEHMVLVADERIEAVVFDDMYIIAVQRQIGGAEYRRQQVIKPAFRLFVGNQADGGGRQSQAQKYQGKKQAAHLGSPY